MTITRPSFATFVAEHVRELPLPGRGNTADRHLRLLEFARRETVSLARLAEGHADAIAILSEAHRDPVGSSTYGVWASGGPQDTLTYDPDSSTISGTKPFCSGLGIVDRALIAVGADDATMLFDVGDLDRRTVDIDTAGWNTPALADTLTGSIRFQNHPVTSDPIGPPGWYLRRPGFWHGACGPASCWAGAAIGLVDHAETSTPEDPHRRSHLGALRAAAWSLSSLLEAAGDQIDARPGDARQARLRALSLRHTVERTCSEILDHFSQAFGPRPFVASEGIAQRHADTHLYLRQHHAERDLAELGRCDEG